MNEYNEVRMKGVKVSTNFSGYWTSTY